MKTKYNVVAVKKETDSKRAKSAFFSAIGTTSAERVADSFSASRTDSAAIFYFDGLAIRAPLEVENGHYSVEVFSRGPEVVFGDLSTKLDAQGYTLRKA